jgi:hypothetical protein
MKNKIQLLNSKFFFHIIILLLCSFITVYKAKVSYDSFLKSNIHIYDGVTYQYQQIVRYEKFEGDFSLVNRYSQAFYEFQGNFVSAAYSSFITFFFPSFLKNDLDVFLRSLFSLSVFVISIYIYFKDKIKPFKLILIITTILQFPLFYHHQVGLGSYIPELTASLILVSGFIFMLHFFTNFKFHFCFLGLILMILSISLRFNFFAYCFLFSIPLLILFIKKWLLFDYNLKKKVIILFSICLLFTGAYIIYFFVPFYKYYTETAYSYSYFSLAFSTLTNNLNDYFSWAGFLAILLIVFTNEKREKWIINNFLVSYPFLIFFIFIIVYLQSENIPHINSAMAVFFSLLSFVSFPFLKNKFPKLLSDKFLYMNLTLIIIILNFNYLNNLNSKKNSPLYKVQRNIISFFEKKIIENPKELPTYFCAFEGMAEIPINVGVYAKTNKLLSVSQFFYNHDIFYLNSVNCKNASECFEKYKSHFTSIDYIIINESNPKINLFPIAKSFNIKLKDYFKNNPSFEVCKKISSNFYGPILIYKHK